MDAGHAPRLLPGIRPPGKHTDQRVVQERRPNHVEHQAGAQAAHERAPRPVRVPRRQEGVVSELAALPRGGMDAAIGSTEATIGVAVHVGGDHCMVERRVKRDLLTSCGVIHLDGAQRLLPPCPSAPTKLPPRRPLRGEIAPRPGGIHVRDSHMQLHHAFGAACRMGGEQNEFLYLSPLIVDATHSPPSRQLGLLRSLGRHLSIRPGLVAARAELGVEEEFVTRPLVLKSLEPLDGAQALWRRRLDVLEVCVSKE